MTDQIPPHNSPASPDEDSDYVEILARAFELQETQATVDVSELCRERPDLVSRVEQALSAGTKLSRLQEASVGFDTRRGRVLGGRYRIDECLGAGSMGVVYRGMDLELDRAVAVKLLRDGSVQSPTARERFRREFEVLAGLQHDAIIKVFDRGESDDGVMYAVMELCAGRTLSGLLEEIATARTANDEAFDDVLKATDDTGVIAHRFDRNVDLEPSFLRLSVRWCRDLALGLQVAHDAGVIHRDVKPSNVFVRSDGRAVLLDFGIAATDSDLKITEEIDPILGTPAYMAPERLQEGEPTAAVDIYGLVATLYHQLTLAAPFRGTPSEVVARLARREPARARSLRPGLPKDLEAILEKGLSRSPASRYPTAAAFADDLSRFLAYQPVAARPMSFSRRLMRRAWSSPEVRGAAAILVIAALVLGTVYYRNQQIRTQEEAFESVRRTIDPSIVLCSTGSRAIQDDELRAGAAKKFDQLVELSSKPVPALVLRGCFLWDHGDREGAAADFRSLAEAVETPFLQALATRVEESVGAEEDGPQQIDLSGLPTVSSADECYAFTILDSRNGRLDPEVLAAFLDQAERNTSHVEELALWLRVIEQVIRKNPSEAASAYRRLYDDAQSFSGDHGAASAGSLYVVGAALMHDRRFDEAADVLRDAVGLSPAGHSARLSLGSALCLAERFEEAVPELRTVVGMRPGSKFAHTTLLKACIGAEDFDGASQALSASPFGSGGWRTSMWQGRIDFGRARLAFAERDLEEARRFAVRAEASFADAASVNVAVSQSFEAIASRWIANSSPQDGTYFAEMIQVARQRALDWGAVRTLAWMLPNTLDAAQTTALQNYLLDLAKALDPEAERRHRSR